MRVELSLGSLEEEGEEEKEKLIPQGSALTNRTHEFSVGARDASSRKLQAHHWSLIMHGSTPQAFLDPQDPSDKRTNFVAGNNMLWNFFDITVNHFINDHYPCNYGQVRFNKC